MSKQTHHTVEVTNSSDPKIIVALDVSDVALALALAKQLDPALCHLKIGKELFTAGGPKIVEFLHQLGYKIFLDLKFHDIPNTVAKACRVVTNLGIWMVSIHALGGKRMMQAAMAACEDTKLKKPKLVAVTVLTSMEAQDLKEVGISTSPQQQVLKLTLLAHKSGMDGVVCSPLELETIRSCITDTFCLVTPGIRSVTPESESSQDDQKRIATPRQALERGANFLVIGRPIVQARNPLKTLMDIYQNI